MDKTYQKINDRLYFPCERNRIDSLPSEKLSFNSTQDGKNPRVTTCTHHQGFKLWEDELFSLIDCDSCGFIHASPIPPQKDLDEFYKKTFYKQERKKEYFDDQKSQQTWWNRVFDKRLARFEQHLGRKGSILDIGCGPGFFLDRARIAGWETIGLEPSYDAHSYASNKLKLNVICGSIENLPHALGESKIDVVYSHGVIEHLRDPRGAINLVLNLLRNDGLVFTSAANDFNPYQAAAVSLTGVRPWWILPPEHLNYFTVKSLKSFHEAHGFSTLDLRTSFPIDQFLLMGDNYVASPELGPQVHGKRVAYETILNSCGFEGLLDRIEESNAEIGVGRQTDYLGRLNG